MLKGKSSSQKAITSTKGLKMRKNIPNLSSSSRRTQWKVFFVVVMIHRFSLFCTRFFLRVVFQSFFLFVLCILKKIYLELADLNAKRFFLYDQVGSLSLLPILFIVFFPLSHSLSVVSSTKKINKKRMRKKTQEDEESFGVEILSNFIQQKN